MELKEAVAKSIEVFRDNKNQDDDGIIQKLIELGIEESLANRLVNFVTSAFCRAMYEDSDLTFQHFYVFFDSRKRTSEPQLLIDEPVFVEAYKIAKAELGKTGKDESYLTIASRDAEYKVIQQFIENGSDLKNVELAPMYIYNPSYFYSTKKWWQIWK
jgi:hypothetical protein